MRNKTRFKNAISTADASNDTVRIHPYDSYRLTACERPNPMHYLQTSRRRKHKGDTAHSPAPVHPL